MMKEQKGVMISYSVRVDGILTSTGGGISGGDGKTSQSY